MRVTAIPSQITALQRGEEIELLVRMEPQPNECEILCGVNEHGQVLVKDPSRAIGRSRIIDCPVSIGDPVEVVCSECGGDGVIMFTRGEHVDGMYCRHDVHIVTTCVQSIARREVDGVHHWVLRCGRDKR